MSRWRSSAPLGSLTAVRIIETFQSYRRLLFLPLGICLPNAFQPMRTPMAGHLYLLRYSARFSAGCAVVEVEAAFIIGTIAAVNYVSFSRLLQLVRIDDMVSRKVHGSVINGWHMKDPEFGCNTHVNKNKPASIWGGEGGHNQCTRFSHAFR